jgi:hypothetical protein
LHCSLKMSDSIPCCCAALSVSFVIAGHHATKCRAKVL